MPPASSKTVSQSSGEVQGTPGEPCGLIMLGYAVKVLASLALLSVAAEGARILAVLPVPARSHHIAICAVTKALADRGHEVTLVTGLEKDSKILPANNKIIGLENPFQDRVDDSLKNFWENKQNPLETLTFLMSWGTKMVNVTLNNAAFQAEVNKPGQKYDLILTEMFFFQEGFVGLGSQFNAPVVAMNPFGTAQWINEFMGNPVNPSWVPSPFLGFSDTMSFSERALNTIQHVMTHVLYNYYYLPMQQEILSQHWPDAKPIGDLMRSSLALTLVNNHFTLTYPMPMSPNIVEVGGVHISDKRNPLPKDLQDFMDSAKDGVVYFSMGSNLKLEHAPKAKRDAILGALGALKQSVLLKWDGPKPKAAPNIRFIEWAPQSDLLAHPNVRVFVTHGGLLSTQESVYHGVPLVGIPVFGDQDFNMRLATTKGFCVQVNLREMSRESLSAALKEVIENPKYKEAAGRLSRLFRSKPVQPQEMAVFAIEHVLQHGGDHLRPSSVHLPLYQLLLLDVILVAVVPFLAVLLCCRALCCRRSKAASVASQKKKNN